MYLFIYFFGGGCAENSLFLRTIVWKKDSLSLHFFSCSKTEQGSYSTSHLLHGSKLFDAQNFTAEIQKHN